MIPARTKEIRSFANTVGLVLVAITTWVSWRASACTYPWVGSVGLVLILLGFLAPALLDPVERLWMKLAHALGWVMTRVILTVVFFVIVIPQGLLMRLTGTDQLKRRLDPELESYFDDPPAYLSNRKHFERPF